MDRKISKELFIEELKSKNISMRSLGNKKSKNYVGISYATIQRGVASGYMSENVLSHLSEKLDIDTFILGESVLVELERLRKENKYYKTCLRKFRFVLNNLSYDI